MIGLGIGVAWKINKNANSYVNTIVLNFKNRVAADGGSFEAEACLVATLTTLNNIN